VLKLDKHVAAEHYAKLRAKIFLRYAPKDRKGRATTRYIEEWLDPTTGKAMGINENDVWIVAVALTHNLKLVTNDKKMGRILAVAPAGFSILNWASS
jgi:predicted nucleic acid-binding protein